MHEGPPQSLHETAAADVAALLETLRVTQIEQGVSQTSLARAIGTTQSAVSEALWGNPVPGLPLAARLAAGLGYQVTATPRPPVDAHVGPRTVDATGVRITRVSTALGASLAQLLRRETEPHDAPHPYAQQ